MGLQSGGGHKWIMNLLLGVFRESIRSAVLREIRSAIDAQIPVLRSKLGAVIGVHASLGTQHTTLVVLYELV